MRRSPLLHVLCLSLVPMLAACGATDPYVYKHKEFDRADKDFNKPLADRTEMTICYNGMRTSDGQVAALAEEECGKFGKPAHAEGKDVGACPLLVPVEAHFACIAPAGSPATAAAATSEQAPDTAAPVPPVE